MRKALFGYFLVCIISTFFFNVKVYSQCLSCTSHIDPVFGGNVCGLQPATIQLVSSASECLTGTASCSNGPVFTYSISFSSPVRGFLAEFPGGYLLSYSAYGANPSFDPCTQPNSIAPTPLSADNSNVITSVTLSIRWTSPGAKTVRVFGYIRDNNSSGFPNMNSSYGCNETTVSFTGVPAPPSSIFLSSPKCYPKGWVLGNQASPGATHYVWTYQGNSTPIGTYTTVYGPTVNASQTIGICVYAYNGCGFSTPTCSTLVVPGVPWCGGGWRAKPGNSTALTDGNTPAFKDGIAIYPNPASNVLTLYNAKKGLFTAEFRSLTGQLVYNTTFQGEKRTNIDVTKFAKGGYVVIIRENGAVTERRKIIIQ